MARLCCGWDHLWLYNRCSPEKQNQKDVCVYIYNNYKEMAHTFVEAKSLNTCTDNKETQESQWCISSRLEIQEEPIFQLESEVRKKP